MACNCRKTTRPLGAKVQQASGSTMPHNAATTPTTPPSQPTGNTQSFTMTDPTGRVQSFGSKLELDAAKVRASRP